MSTNLITENHPVLPSSAFIHVHVARRACGAKQIIWKKIVQNNWTCNKAENPGCWKAKGRLHVSINLANAK